MNITHDLRHRFPTAANFAAHAQALEDFGNRLHRKNESPILHLTVAFSEWLRTDGASDGYGGPNVTTPLYHALIAALNFDTGRLDAGTIAHWAYDACEAAGIDPDLS